MVIKYECVPTHGYWTSMLEKGEKEKLQFEDFC
jgi:hypothetical protein